jgi:hypothetical protein
MYPGSGFPTKAMACISLVAGALIVVACAQPSTSDADPVASASANDSTGNTGQCCSPLRYFCKCVYREPTSQGSDFWWPELYQFDMNAGTQRLMGNLPDMASDQDSPRYNAKADCQAALDDEPRCHL